jgi:hypothetical protein
MSDIGNVPQRGQPLTLDAGQAFVLVDGIIDGLAELSEQIDSLEVTIQRIEGLATQNMRGLVSRCKGEMCALRRERTYLASAIDQLHDVIVGDAYVDDDDDEPEAAAE